MPRFRSASDCEDDGIERAPWPSILTLVAVASATLLPLFVALALAA